MALLGWVAGCTSIWSALFTVGNILYMRPLAATFLFIVFIISTLVLITVVRQLWSEGTEP
jgi:solute:Na+ symporter, SSS family